MSVSEFSVANPLKSNRSTARRWVTSHVMRYWYLFATLVLGAFGNAALAAVMPRFIGQAFDEAQAANFAGIRWIAILIIASQLVRAGSQYVRNISAETLGQRVERDARIELYDNLLGKSMTFHDMQPVGDTMARATNDVRELNLLVTVGLNLVVGSSNFMLMPILWAPVYSWQLLFAPLFFVILYAIALVRYLRTLQPIADRVRQSFGVLNGRLAEAIDGIETVKGAAQEEQEVARFADNALTYREAVVDQGRVEARFVPLLLLGLTVAIAFTHSTLLFQRGMLTIGEVIGYTSLMTLFGFPTFVSLTAYSQVARGMAGARRMLELIKRETKLDQNSGGVSAEISGAVEFKDVTAGYVDGIDILKEITFRAEPGETVAIVGQTGAGKSSLVKLINRIYDARQGCVLVDGVDVREWNLASLRQQISIIEQDVFLFSRSIYDNIAFGLRDATKEQIVEAAQDAQAHDFIMSLADGYDTVIGERGATLSGGQRQRIALARAFLTEPRILVLDDSTSAVDSATEDQIQKAIARASANQTTFLITHRLSQIRWADKVVLLKQGKVVAVGDHDSLMEEYAAYRRIFEQYNE